MLFRIIKQLINLNNNLMKTQILNCFVLSFFILTFVSCNAKKAAEDKINETIAEEVVGTMLGTDVETSNISDAEKATGQLDLTIDGKSISEKLNQPVFQIASGGGESEDVIIASMLSTQTQDNKGNAIQFGISGNKNLLKESMVINFEDVGKEGKVAPTLQIVNTGEPTDSNPLGMQITVVKTGTLKVVSFSDEEVKFEIDAMGGDNTAETHNGKNLVPIKGTIVCKNPIMTFMGVKKSEIFN
jgi:hypothetical protein